MARRRPDDPKVVRLRDAGTARAEGEPKEIVFDPIKHPGTAYRVYAGGGGPEEVAAALGIRPEVLERWEHQYPEMYKAYELSQEFDNEILRSTRDHALGTWDEKDQRYYGGNPALLRFLCQSRLGMVAAKQPRTEKERFDGLTEAQLKRMGEALLAKVRETERNTGSSAGGSAAADGSRT